MHTNILVVIRGKKTTRTVSSSKKNYLKDLVWDRILEEL